MQCEFDVNLITELCFRCDVGRRVEHNTTAANYSVRICDVNIRSAFAGNMNRHLVVILNISPCLVQNPLKGKVHVW